MNKAISYILLLSLIALATNCRKTTDTPGTNGFDTVAVIAKMKGTRDFTGFRQNIA